MFHAGDLPGDEPFVVAGDPPGRDDRPRRHRGSPRRP
jgi:hypothetical protein